MTEALVVAELALHELWISFRLLAAIVLVMLAGLVGVAVRLLQPLSVPLPWFAAALGVAAAFLAALAAWSFSAERRRGAAAWLVSRSVPRPAILIGWLAALVVPLAVSMLPVGLLGWLTLPHIDGGVYVAALAACFTDLLAALCAGLLAGTLLPRLPAAIVAVVAGLALAAAGGWLAPESVRALPLPGDGLRLLAELPARERPLTDALNAAGASLIAAGLLTAAARLAVERSEL